MTIQQPTGPRTLTRRRIVDSLLGGLVCCHWKGRSEERRPGRRRAATASHGTLEPVDLERSGLSRQHENGGRGERYLPETMGPGAAFVDYDGDGWLDLFVVNSGPCDFLAPNSSLRHRMFRNNRNGTFTDVAAIAGLALPGTYGMGVAVGDYDNDGWPDILITGYGGMTLHHNNGDGTFTDATERAGLTTKAWTTSAVWFDFDGDGFLDLFVCAFVKYSAADRFACAKPDGTTPHYCSPAIFPKAPSLLYRNRGDGTFELVSPGSEIERNAGKALGVVATDVNGDGAMDLFVANDTMQNFLFLNRGSGRWEEIGIPAGVAYSETGQARSGMGVDAHDVDGDGRQDLFVSNLDHEFFSYYRNQGDGTFADLAARHDIARSTKLLSGWGLRFFDFDNDGEPDLLLANGHPDTMIATAKPDVSYAEPLVLFHNQGGRLVDISAKAGPVFRQRFPARGLATGDFRNNGKLGVLVTNNGQAPLLLENVSENSNHWVGLKLEGRRANRDGIGAKITWSAGGKVRSRLKNAGGSYLSYHDPREILGLGPAKRLDWVEVRWPAPSQRVDRFEKVKPGRYYRLVEGGKLAGI